MKLASVTILLFSLNKLINGSFIRSNDVYKHVIDEIYEYYQCEDIVIFHASARNEEASNADIAARLVDLQLHFHRHLMRAQIIDTDTFTDQQVSKIKIMKNYSKKSLLVFLNYFNASKSLFHDLLASSLDVSIPTWLFFLDQKMTIDDFFANTHIPFNSDCLTSITDSNNHEVITEIYRINEESKLQQNIIALWSSDNGIQWFQTNVYQRRNNLFGHHFRVTTISDPPYTLVTNPQNHGIILSGVIGKIMEHLKNELNFTITYRLTEKYGNRLDNGSWTGGIADLVKNVSDIFASSIAMTSFRKEVIDFTMPIFYADDCFFFKKSSNEYVEWNKFLKPFQNDIWIIIMCIVISTSIIVTLILLFHQRINKQMLLKNQESWFISDNILLIYGAFCGQAIQRSFVTSVFIIHITLHLTATVVLAAYSAVLISSLTVSDFKAPFRTLQEFHQNGIYRMGFSKSSVYSDIFRASNDTIMKKIYDTAVKYHTMSSAIGEGIKRICTEKAYAFIAPKHFGSISKDCTLIKSKSVMKLSKAIGLRQHNPFRELFNYHIARMKRYGILDRIIQGTVKKPVQNENELWEAVQIRDIIPLLVMLFINILLAFIILLIEKQRYKNLKKKRLNFSQFLIHHVTNQSKKK